MMWDIRTKIATDGHTCLREPRVLMTVSSHWRAKEEMLKLVGGNITKQLRIKHSHSLYLQSLATKQMNIRHEFGDSMALYAVAVYSSCED